MDTTEAPDNNDGRESTELVSAADDAASTPSPDTPKPSWISATWTLRRWVVIAATAGVLLIGAAIGAATQQATVSDLEDENAALAADNERLERARERLAKQVNDREAQRKADEAKARRLEAERAAEERERAEAERRAAEEAAAAAAAAEAARNTIPGNGIFAIGPEKAPGRYRTEGPSGANPVGCYYAILRAPTSDSFDNIIDNNIVQGPGFADLSDGTFFETTSCQEWVRVG